MSKFFSVFIVVIFVVAVALPVVSNVVGGQGETYYTNSLEGVEVTTWESVTGFVNDDVFTEDPSGDYIKIPRYFLDNGIPVTSYFVTYGATIYWSDEGALSSDEVPTYAEGDEYVNFHDVFTLFSYNNPESYQITVNENYPEGTLLYAYIPIESYDEDGAPVEYTAYENKEEYKPLRCFMRGEGAGPLYDPNGDYLWLNDPDILYDNGLSYYILGGQSYWVWDDTGEGADYHKYTAPTLPTDVGGYYSDLTFTVSQTYDSGDKLYLVGGEDVAYAMAVPYQCVGEGEGIPLGEVIVIALVLVAILSAVSLIAGGRF